MGGETRMVERAVDSRVIRFYQHNVYGNTLSYPVDYADQVLALTGQITLTPRTIRALERMGFRFVEVLRSEVIR